MTIAQDKSSVDALLDRLSGLPLALTQAAAYIGQTAVSIDQYLEYYDNMWKNLMEQQDEYPLQEYAERSVLTTWRISFDQVKKQNKEASNLLQLWSFLYAGDLWYELVACTEGFRTDPDVPDWLTNLTRNRLAFDRALALLIKFSMVEGKTQTASYAMHSVLHSWCRHIGETEAERVPFWELAVSIVGYMVPYSDEKEYWVLQRRLLPHAQVIFTSVDSKTKSEISFDKLSAYDMIAYMFSYQHRYAEAEELYKQVLVRREKALGPEHVDTLFAVHSLGILYYNQDNLVEAERMYKQALAGQERILGPKHIDTLFSVNNLGRLYGRQGKLVEAERMLKHTLFHTEKILGLEHMQILTIVESLGDIYLDQGMLKEAEDMFERALSGFEKVLGPEHPETLVTVHCLGNLYTDQDRLAKAEEMYKRALAGYEKALGPEHTNTIITVYNLGILYAHQDRLAEAEGMYERALAGYEKAFGPEHEDTLDTARNLSIVYAKRDRLAEAEKMHRRAFGKEKAHEPAHMSTVSLAQRLSMPRRFLKAIRKCTVRTRRRKRRPADVS